MNTPIGRAYHSLNTRYNIYFNANEAYEDALDEKMKSLDANLSNLLYIYPYNLENSTKILNQSRSNNYHKSLFSRVSISSFDQSPTSTISTPIFAVGFETAIDKCTKAIKLHSIKARPVKDKAKIKYQGYEEWIRQKEFNPFMKNVWLLLGKVEVQSGDCLRAISTFMYTTKLYPKNRDILLECQLWIARSYAEIGLLDQTQIILRKLHSEVGVSSNLKGLYASIYADFLLKSGKFNDAIPYIQTAINFERNKIQKIRLKYILGQVYERVGDNDNAHKAYHSLQGISVPAKYAINSKIALLSLNQDITKHESVSKLLKLAKNYRNNDYIDKIYYTIGNIYLNRTDTLNAIKYYKLATEKSEQEGYSKIFSELRLADLYFESKDFFTAHSYYSKVAQSINNKDEAYERVTFRNRVLEELSAYVKIVEEQDSLQNANSLSREFAESNELIEKAYIATGRIYRYELEDLSLAVKYYDKVLKRFPNSQNKEEIYYQLFLIAMQQDNRKQMMFYRDKLLTDFAGLNYATMLSQPDFEVNLRNLEYTQDSIYEATYEAYIDNNIKEVRQNYQLIKKKYPLATLMPKFLLLNALTYAQTKDAKSLKMYLDKLVTEYPDADVTVMAKDIIAHLNDGKAILSDGTPIRGMKWNRQSGVLSKDQIVRADEVQFTSDVDSPYLVLLFYKSNIVDRNKLLYQVADYNFSNYSIQTFDLSFEKDNSLELLQIKGFNKFIHVRSYINKAFRPGQLAQLIDPSILIIPVSVENVELLFKKGLKDYIAFYKEQFASQTPDLISYWNGSYPILSNTDSSDSKTDIVFIKKEEPKIFDLTQNNERKNIQNEETSIRADSRSQQDGINHEVNNELSNPVDGLKGLFNKYKSFSELTKEEKLHLKQEQKRIREQNIQLRLIEKSRQDSIQLSRKIGQDIAKEQKRQQEEERKRRADERTRILKEKRDIAKSRKRSREAMRKTKGIRREKTHRSYLNQ